MYIDASIRPPLTQEHVAQMGLARKINSTVGTKREINCNFSQGHLEYAESSRHELRQYNYPCRRREMGTLPCWQALRRAGLHSSEK